MVDVKSKPPAEEAQTLTAKMATDLVQTQFFT